MTDDALNLTLGDLREAPWNPREIEPENLAALGESLETFGELDCIVWNRRTGHLVTGHQRVKALRAKGAQMIARPGVDDDEWRWALRAPDGRSFQVRVVDWDETTHVAANIAANSPHLMGSFTAELAPILDKLDEEMPAKMETLRLTELVPDAALLLAMRPDAKEETLLGNVDETAIKQITATMTIPPKAWLLHGELLQRKFEALAQAWGIEITWP